MYFDGMFRKKSGRPASIGMFVPYRGVTCGRKYDGRRLTPGSCEGTAAGDGPTANYLRSPAYPPAVATIEILVTAVHVLSIGVVVGGYVAACWSPFLLLDPLGGLFELGPSADPSSNYLLAAVAVGTVHAGIFLALVLGSIAPVMALFYAGIGTAVCWMAVAGVVFPATGRRWTGEADWFRAGIALCAGALWYALVTIVPPFVLWTMLLARS